METVNAGDVLTATARFVDLREREGRLGRMLISVRETVYRRDGRVAARPRRTSISY